MPHQFPTFQAKRVHEKDIAEKLTKLLYPNFVFNRFGNDQGEPDVIFEKDDSALGVEVTTAYYEDVKIANVADIKEMDSQMCSVVDRMVLKKSTRKYSGVDKTVLCIETLDPAGSEFSIVNCLLNLSIPEKHPFVEIYVLSYTVVGGEYEIFKIFPSDK